MVRGCGAVPPVAIPGHSKPEAYPVPAKRCESLMVLIAGALDARITEERKDGPSAQAGINDLYAAIPRKGPEGMAQAYKGHPGAVQKKHEERLEDPRAPSSASSGMEDRRKIKLRSAG